MKGKAALFFLGVVIAGSVMLAGGCGGSDNSNGGNGTPPLQTASPTSAETAGREMLRNMIPGAADLPGFTLYEANFVDNDEASAQAPEPDARLARLNEMGRVLGYHALFVPAEGAPAGTPEAILWSVNLFQEPDGALEFINESPEETEGTTLEPLDVGTLGPNAVGFVFRSLDPAKPASGYTIAFTEDAIEASVTALYKGAESSPDYILSLAQQARTLVEGAAQGGAAPQAPLEGGPTAAAEAVPTEIPGGLQVPIRAVVGTPEP